MTAGAGAGALADDDYRTLAHFRHALRAFLAFSEQAARDAGLTPSQHQLLLAVRGYPGDEPPSTTEVATMLALRLHSATELVARAEANGLVVREADPGDGRRALLSLTPEGDARLEALSVLHRHELREFRTELAAILHQLD
ncbi:MAG TPA: MarR family transcriptional regulator [Acidimicrobiales bacterium]|jgi:DNA-binding MarR family transcriptional regulator